MKIVFNRNKLILLRNRMYKSYVCFVTRQKIWFVKKIWREMRLDRRILYVSPNWLLYSTPINDFLAPR